MEEDETEATEIAATSEALRIAFEQHYLHLLKLAVALSGRQESAEDLVQEAFVRAAPRIQFLDPDAIAPYLSKVVINLWRNRLRRLAVERRRVPAGPHAVEPEMVEDRDKIWTALKRLPKRQRACVVLRFYEDLSEAQVAEILDCSIGTVKSQTSRGLTRLRRIVMRDGD
jgi:RNA polymerase sigma-70 factor (sigma-E family)